MERSLAAAASTSSPRRRRAVSRTSPAVRRLALRIAALVALACSAGCGERTAPSDSASDSGSDAVSPAETETPAATPPTATPGDIHIPVADDAPRQPGLVEGTVSYVADPARPWRQSRYYVRDRSSGALAEAVVALRPEGAADDATSVSGEAPDDEPTREPTREPTTWHIDQRNFQFVPETLAIHAGDSVRFTNSDAELHNVRTNDGERPFNVSLTTGMESVQRFRRSGGIEAPVRLGCVFHGSMRGWVYVFEHRFHHVTGADGGFRFERVEPGVYWLDVVHPAGGLRWSQRVEILPGASERIDVRLSPAKADAPAPSPAPDVPPPTQSQSTQEE